MSKTSNVADLMARLQQKIEQDRQQIEGLTQSELKKLANNLRQSVQDESYITVRDIKEHTRWMNAALWGAWLRSVVVGVCLFLGILRRELGPDAVAVEPHRKPHRDEGRVPGGDQRATPHRRAGSRRRRGAWFSTRERRGGEFVVLPAGVAPESTLDRGRAACRAAIQRVKELYDRVRTAVDERLDRAVEAVRSGDGAAGRAGRGIAAASCSGSKKRSRT